MSTIPTKLSDSAFEKYVLPYLSQAKRGYVCKIPLLKVFNYILYFLHTGCQWAELPIDPDPEDPTSPEISYHAIYYHYRKWCRDGSLEAVWVNSIDELELNELLDLTHVNLDGTHTLAKKGGDSAVYQQRKRAKTTNILPMVEANGFIIATSPIIAGNHNDAYELVSNLQSAFGFIQSLGLDISGSYFNGDKAFDTVACRKTCFNYGLIPNVAENQRNRKTSKRGRKRLFNQEIYKQRFVAERTFAWVDKFKRLLIRLEREDLYFLGGHFIAFAMINLRHFCSS
jgi:transposase